MSHWIFTVTTHKTADWILSADEIFRQRMLDKFWGLGEKTPNRNSLREGDCVVFYVGLPTKAFAGSATLSGKSWRLTDEERESISHGKTFYRAEYGVRLAKIQVWDTPRSAESVVPSLKFVENKEFWFTYLQGGVRQISEEDFRVITLGARSIDAAPGTSPESLMSASEFALEAHLEDFIDKNWESIDFGARLDRYQSDEQSGRQFPAGPWSIDFLCTEKGTGAFVVVELKKGKSSDAAVGQVLRYMSWVRKNLAREGQKVRGVIISREVDEA